MTFDAKISVTRMHSSRMRAGRSLTICRSLLPGGVSALGECLFWGVSAPGGVSAGGVSGLGVSAPGGSPWQGVVSQHVLRQTPPSVNRMTNRCKNITLATTSLWPVKMKKKKTLPRVSLERVLNALTQFFIGQRTKSEKSMSQQFLSKRVDIVVCLLTALRMIMLFRYY